MKKNILKYILSFLLAGVLVFFAFRGVDWSAFWSGLGQTRLLWLGMFVIFSLLALLFREERWRAIILPIDQNARRLDIWDANNVGNLVNVVLPGAGEFVRCGYITRRNMTYDKALGTIVCERVCDLVAVIALFAIALLTGWSRFGSFFVEQIWTPLTGRLGFSLWWVFAGVVLVLAALIWAVFHWSSSNKVFGKMAGWIRGLGAGFASIGKMQHKWMFVLYTVLIWTMYVLMSWAGFKALPPLADQGVANALFISAVGNVASVIPVPGGIGAFHYLVKETLETLFGAPENMGLVYAVFCHESHAVLIIILGIISYIRLTLRKKA